MESGGSVKKARMKHPPLTWSISSTTAQSSAKVSITGEL